MNFPTKFKSIWFYYPLILSALIAILLLFKTISFDLIGFKKESYGTHKLIVWIITFIPMLFLLTSGYWLKQTFQKKILLTGLISLLIAINYRINTGYFFTIVFSLSVVIYFLFEKKIYKLSFFGLLIILYFAINVISLLWTSKLNDGILLLRHLSPLVFIPFIFCFFKLKKKDFDLIFLILFRSSMLFVFFSICSRVIQSRFLNIPIFPDSIFEKIILNSIDSFAIVFAWSNYIHPTYIGLLLLFSLATGWYLLFKSDTEDGVTITEFAFMIITTFLLVILSASRFMFVGWLIVNTSGVLYLLRKNKKVIKYAIAALAIFTVVFTIRYSNKISDFYKDPLRVCHYKAAYQSINDNTWHGTGLGGMTTYINYDNPIYAHLVILPVFTHRHPHNQFIGDLMQTGVFGLVTIIFIVAYLLFSSFKYRNWLLLVYSVLFLLLMNIEMPLIYEKGIFYFALINSLLFKMNEDQIAV